MENPLRIKFFWNLKISYQIALIAVINSYGHWSSRHHGHRYCLFFNHLTSYRAKAPWCASSAPGACLLSIRSWRIICLLPGFLLQRMESCVFGNRIARRVSMSSIARIFRGIASGSTSYWSWSTYISCTTPWCKVPTVQRISRTLWLHTFTFGFVNGPRATRSLVLWLSLFSSKFRSSVEFLRVYICPYRVCYFFCLGIMIV